MRITYRTLGRLIQRMDKHQLNSDVTIELRTRGANFWSPLEDECFSAEMRIAGPNHASLEEGHPVIYANEIDENHQRIDNSAEIALQIGLDPESLSDQEIDHFVVDARTEERHKLLLCLDRHGLTVELPNGKYLTLDVSDGALNIYHNDHEGDEGTKVHSVELK